MYEKINPFKSENYKKNIDKKPSGFIGKLFNMLKKILGINSVKNLPENSSQVATKTSSKTEENPLYATYRRDSGYESSLDEGSGYEEISDYKKKENNNPGLQDKLSVSGLSEDQVNQILTLTPPPVPKKTPGAYISLDAPDVNWETYPRDNANLPTSQKPFPAPRKSLNSDQRSGAKPPLAPKPSFPKQFQKPEDGKSTPLPKPRTSKATPATKMSTEENRVKKIVERFEAGNVKGPGG